MFVRSSKFDALAARYERLFEKYMNLVAERDRADDEHADQLLGGTREIASLRAGRDDLDRKWRRAEDALVCAAEENAGLESEIRSLVVERDALRAEAEDTRAFERDLAVVLRKNAALYARLAPRDRSE